jgi:hypothetical protein
LCCEEFVIVAAHRGQPGTPDATGTLARALGDLHDPSGRVTIGMLSAARFVTSRAPVFGQAYRSTSPQEPRQARPVCHEWSTVRKTQGALIAKLERQAIFTSGEVATIVHKLREAVGIEAISCTGRWLAGAEAARWLGRSSVDFLIGYEQN